MTSNHDILRYLKLANALRVGKKVSGYLYIHKSALDSESPPLSDCLDEWYAELAAPGAWNIAKLSLSAGKVSFLSYTDFYSQEHPVLKKAVTLNLSDKTWRVSNYADSENPPILHRKETFVSDYDPHFERFARLTSEEENHGLFDNPTRIGHRRQWAELLSTKGLRLIDHHVIPTNAEEDDR